MGILDVKTCHSAETRLSQELVSFEENTNHNYNHIYHIFLLPLSHIVQLHEY